MLDMGSQECHSEYEPGESTSGFFAVALTQVP